MQSRGYTQEQAEALYVAAGNRQHEKLTQLIARGIPANVWVDRHKTTPLHVAVRLRDTRSVQVLLENGADKTVKDEEQKTAIDVNKDYSDESIFNLLNPEIALENARINNDIDEIKNRYS